MYDWGWRALVQCYDRLVWQAYAKPELKSIRLLNAKNYVVMSANPEYA